MMPVIKRNGQIRICIDLKRLNEAVKRERYVLLTGEEIAAKLVGSTVFSKLDAASGFWQVSLDNNHHINLKILFPALTTLYH